MLVRQLKLIHQAISIGNNIVKNYDAIVLCVRATDIYLLYN